MIITKLITISDIHYDAERALRNEVLLRPIGLPDHFWEMHDSKALHFVALNSDTVIGCVLLLPRDGNIAQLLQMAIHFDYQRKGIGNLLIDALTAVAQADGIIEVFCHSRDSAVDFYKKNGFEIYGEPFIEVGVKHYYMRRRL